MERGDVLGGLRTRLAEGGPLFGAWCATPSEMAAEVLVGEGFDYIGFDCQHGLMDVGHVWRMLQAVRWSPVLPIVRVPSGTLESIGRALDGGAAAVVVPMVETTEQAEAAAYACRYPPAGGRSFGPTRGSMILGSDTDTVNRAVACLVMIETVAGVAAADQICSTPGVDGVYIGPTDLAISMGVGADEMFRSEHLAAIAEVSQACRRAGRIVGIHAGTGLRGRMLAETGFDLCTIAADVALLRAVARSELALARGH